MVGPDPESMGGIARVVKNWKNDGLFNEYNITYISTTPSSEQGKFVFVLWSIFLFLKLCITTKTIVYIHTASFNSFYRKSIFIMIALLNRLPVVLHIHPSYFLTFLSEAPSLLRAFMFFLLRRVSCFVVLTDQTLLGIGRLFPAIPVFVLRNVVGDDLLERQEVARQTRTALFLGWYVEEKGVYELVDAVEILLDKGCRMELECYGTKEEQRLRGYVARKNLEQWIRVNGWADDETKIRALLSSTMLILPSHTEGIPNVILEAWATKTPVVSTAVGGLAEILVDEHNAIVAQAKNPLHLSLTIEKCLSRPELRKKIAQNAYETILNEYTMLSIREQFARIIASVHHQA